MFGSDFSEFKRFKFETRPASPLNQQNKLESSFLICLKISFCAFEYTCVTFFYTVMPILPPLLSRPEY